MKRNSKFEVSTKTQVAILLILALCLSGFLALGDDGTVCPRLEGVKTLCYTVPSPTPTPTPDDQPPEQNVGCTSNSQCGSVTCYSGGTPKTVTVANSDPGGQCISSHTSSNCSGEGGGCTQTTVCDQTSAPSCTESQVSCTDNSGATATTIQAICGSDGTCSNPTCPSGSGGGGGCPSESHCN